MSVGPPGGKGMTSLRGRDGYLSCERIAGAASAVPASTLAPIRSVRLSMTPSSAVDEHGGVLTQKRRALLPAVSCRLPYGRMLIEKPGVLS